MQCNKSRATPLLPKRRVCAQRDVTSVPVPAGLKTIINALLHSFRQLAEVMTLTIFCLMVFALFALQVYMGELRNKCVRRPLDRNATQLEWAQ